MGKNLSWNVAEFEGWYNQLPAGEKRRRAWSGLTATQRKAYNELSTFRIFARFASLSIDPRTIKACNPPQPDLVCEISGEAHYWELGEVTDESLARRRNLALKEGKAISGGSFLAGGPAFDLASTTTKMGAPSFVLFEGREPETPAVNVLTHA